MKAENLFKQHIEGLVDAKSLYLEYAQLTKEEIYLMVDLLIADKDRNADEKAEIILYLVLFSHACGDKLPQKLYDYLLANEIYYYRGMYLRAGEKTALELIELLKNKSGSRQLPVNHILCALACIPCEIVKNFLLENSQEPLPKWAKELYIKPIEYSTLGGWTVDENGHIVSLFSKKIQAFKKCKKGNGTPEAPLSLLDEKCDFCGRHLVLIFNGKNKLATCVNCSGYQNIFTKLEGEKIVWHPKNKRGEFLTKHPDYVFAEDNSDENVQEMFEYDLALSGEERKYTYTANQFAKISRTQTGGLPTEINDVEYPVCPDCGREMSFAGQLDVDDVQEYGEGMYYFFVCEHCKSIACNYGQT